jgi:RNA polymerase sigma factor (sigma-70 family)
MSTAPGKALDRVLAGEDAELVKDCIAGREPAWVALIAKYKNLIYSIPIKYKFSQEEASDIFQSVCLDLICELPRLRDPKALAGWLIRVTHNKCFHLKCDGNRHSSIEDDQYEPTIASEDIPDNLLHRLEQDQYVRTAIADLSPRCQELVHKLFFEFPASPYQKVAQELGLAIGSIGFIRRRCLDRLRQRLEELGICSR